MCEIFGCSMGVQRWYIWLKMWIFMVKLITTAKIILQTYIWTFDNSKYSGLWLSSTFDLVGGHGGTQITKKWTKMKLTVRIFEKYICWCSQCPPNPLILNQKHIRDFDRGSYLYIGLPWWLFLSSWPPNTDHTVTMIMIFMIKTVIWQV